MVGLEIVASMLATSTVKAVTKFLDEKVAEYVGKKFGNNLPEDFESLKKEIEELKINLDAKESAEVSQADIEEVNKTITKIEQKQNYSSDKIISDSIFLEWSENKLDIEYQAPVVKRELEMLLDKAKELKISENKRWDIRQIISAIDLNLKDSIDARLKYELGLVGHEEVRKYEMSLRQSIFAARDLFGKFYNVK